MFESYTVTIPLQLGKIAKLEGEIARQTNLFLNELRVSRGRSGDPPEYVWLHASSLAFIIEISTGYLTLIAHARPAASVLARAAAEVEEARRLHDLKPR